jgi:hypothetical protein
MGKYSEMHIALQDEIMNLSYLAGEGELSNLEALIEMYGHKKEFEKSLSLIKDFEDTKIHEIANEASQYPEGYHGFEVKMINGRKTFNYKNIPAWIEADNEKKRIEDQYRAMFEAKAKGLPHANVSHEGEELPLPEINYSKSYLVIKQKI